MTSVKHGAFYGWPRSYYGQNVDVWMQPQRPDLAVKAIAPDDALGAHTASPGLTFNTGNLFPDNMKGGALLVATTSATRRSAWCLRPSLRQSRNRLIAP